MDFMAKYPFSKETKSYLEKEGRDFESLHDELDYALERAKQSVQGERKGKWPTQTEIYTYPLSKILVSLLNDYYISKKFAKGEAKRVEHLLQGDTEENLEKLAAEFFDFEKNKSEYLIPVYQYLNYVPNLDEYKLVNKNLSNGKVSINFNEMAILLSQVMYSSIFKMKANKKDFPKKFIDMSNELKKYKRYDDDIKGPVNMEAFPPCMRKIYQDLQTQANVGHTARFVFACFLGNINMSIEEALKTFSKQENFSEPRARYHLEHAFGLKTGTKYSVPACQKMITYGLCYRDNSCQWPAPILYYKNKAFRRVKNAGN